MNGNHQIFVTLWTTLLLDNNINNAEITNNYQIYYLIYDVYFQNINILWYFPAGRYILVVSFVLYLRQWNLIFTCKILLSTQFNIALLFFNLDISWIFFISKFVGLWWLWNIFFIIIGLYSLLKANIWKVWMVLQWKSLIMTSLTEINLKNLVNF